MAERNRPDGGRAGAGSSGETVRARVGHDGATRGGGAERRRAHCRGNVRVAAQDRRARSARSVGVVGVPFDGALAVVEVRGQPADRPGTRARRPRARTAPDGARRLHGREVVVLQGAGADPRRAGTRDGSRSRRACARGDGSAARHHRLGVRAGATPQRTRTRGAHPRRPSAVNGRRRRQLRHAGDARARSISSPSSWSRSTRP